MAVETTPPISTNQPVDAIVGAPKPEKSCATPPIVQKMPMMNPNDVDRRGGVAHQQQRDQDRQQAEDDQAEPFALGPDRLEQPHEPEDQQPDPEDHRDGVDRLARA